MASTFTKTVLLYILLLIAIVKSQTDEPSERDYGWTVPWIWIMMLANVMSAVIILVSLIYFIHKVRQDKDSNVSGNHVNKAPIIFQIVMSIFGFVSCMAYGLGRPNIFIDIHTTSYCYMIWAVSLFSWAVGRYFTLLSFLFRIWMAFSASALAYPTWLIIFLGAFLTVAASGVIALLAVTSVPDIAYANDNISVTLCMSYDTDKLVLAKYVSQAIDFGLVIIFLYMFTKKLHTLRNMNKEDKRSRRFRRAPSKSSTGSSQNKNTEKTAAIISSMPGKKQAISIGSPSATPDISNNNGNTYKNTVQLTPTTGGRNDNNSNNNGKKKVSFMIATRQRKSSAVKKDYGKPHELDALEKLMMKQTILVFVVVISTWFSLGWSIFDGRFSLFLGVDAMVNTICSLFVFKYTNRFWNGCLHCCRCYCLYDCCMEICGCFPCDGEDGCCSWCAGCDDMIQRMGTSVRKMSLRSSSTGSRDGSPEKQLEECMDVDVKTENNTKVNSLSNRERVNTVENEERDRKDSEIP